MPVAKFTCPKCKAVLRPAKPLPSGKKVSCPKCKAAFTVTDPDEEKAIKAGKPGGKPALSKNDPLYDEGPETYAVIKEEEQVEDEEEDDDEDEDGEPKPKKPKKDRARSEDLEFRLNTDIPDPRGPAQAAVISPSNLLMLVATLACLVAIWSIFRGAWPFLFLEDIVDATDFNGPDTRGSMDDDDKPKEQKKAATLKKLFPVKDKTNDLDFERLTPEQKKQYNDKRDEVWLWDVGYIVCGAIILAYNVVIIIGGVKMQNMEVYPLAMTASIMALGLSFPGLGQLAGFICISTLRSKKVLDGWFYIPPSATPHKKEKKKEVL
jgi:hypothetical protein